MSARAPEPCRLALLGGPLSTRPAHGLGPDRLELWAPDSLRRPRSSCALGGPFQGQRAFHPHRDQWTVTPVCSLSGYDATMFRFLVDTCVWLDLAKDHQQAPALLNVIEQMIKEELLALIVPRIVLEEFKRNRDRIEKDSARSLASHFRQVKDAVNKVGGPKAKTKNILRRLDDVNHKATIIGGAASGILDRIEKLLSSEVPVDATDALKLLAAQRAVEKKAPFHGGRNSMADAMLIEIYAGCVRDSAKAGMRFAFVTHNKNDFSVANGNRKLPHPDLATYFSRSSPSTSSTLPKRFAGVEPSLVSDLMLEHSWSQESRGLTEILQAEDLLFHQVWYNRHHNLRHKVKSGAIKIVEKETYPRRQEHGKTDDPARRMGSRASCSGESREALRCRKPRTVGRLRLGNDQREALRAALGARR